MKITNINELIRKKAESDALYWELQELLGGMDKELLSVCDAEGPMGAELERIVAAGGKRLRPMLAALCYRMGGRTDFDIQPLMTMLELMHTASLIHDDVVDNADLRRGRRTINRSRGNAAAVQSGDFLLAKAMERLHIYRGTPINETLAEVSAQMCVGELQQQKLRFDARAQTLDLYLTQIKRKTASLMAASCRTGAIAGGMDIEHAGMLGIYGEKLGMAFQFRDDMLDFSEEAVSGKAAGQDLKSGVFTLPIIRLLETGVPESVRGLIMKRDKTCEEISRLVDDVRRTDALAYTEKAVREKIGEAVEALQCFPVSPEKSALARLAQALAEDHA